MPPPLPFEVQEMILHELGHENIDNIDHDTLRTWARTLGCCSLVCKSWVSICQIHLMRVVDLESGKQLEKMASVLAAAECPLRSWPVKLRLSPLAGFQSSHHLVPYHLSIKLPSLDVLEYRGVFMAKGFQRSTVIAHPTFSMHLKQFRTITSLILREYRFQNFWDLRRFIVSLTSLSTLVINNTDWPSPSEELGRFPSLLHTASRLSEVRVERCTSINDILWCWITSCRPSTSGPPILPDNEFPIPHLTIKDGITIKKLVRLCMPGYVTCNWKRSYNSELNICKLFSKFLSILVCLFFFREFERRG